MKKLRIMIPLVLILTMLIPQLSFGEEKREPPGTLEKGISNFVFAVCDFFVAKVIEPSHLSIEAIIKQDAMLGERLNITAIITENSPFDGSASSSAKPGIKTIFSKITTLFAPSLTMIAIAIFMCSLVYIGLLTLMSTSSSKRAEYTQKFMVWLTGLLMLFVFNYVMVYVIDINNLLAKFFLEQGHVLAASTPATTLTPITAAGPIKNDYATTIKNNSSTLDLLHKTNNTNTTTTNTTNTNATNNTAITNLVDAIKAYERKGGSGWVDVGGGIKVFENAKSKSGELFTMAALTGSSKQKYGYFFKLNENQFKNESSVISNLFNTKNPGIIQSDELKPEDKTYLDADHYTSPIHRGNKIYYNKSYDIKVDSKELKLSVVFKDKEPIITKENIDFVCLIGKMWNIAPTHIDESNLPFAITPLSTSLFETVFALPTIDEVVRTQDGVYANRNSTPPTTDQLLIDLYGEYIDNPNSFPYVALYAMGIFQTIWIYVVYFIRVFMISFLVLIFPLVIGIYCIDKLNDNKSAVFTDWYKEFYSNIFTNSAHALTYAMITTVIASQDFKDMPWVKVAALFFVIPAGNLIRKIFRLEKASGMDRVGLGSVLASGMLAREVIGRGAKGVAGIASGAGDIGVTMAASRSRLKGLGGGGSGKGSDAGPMSMGEKWAGYSKGMRKMGGGAGSLFGGVGGGATGLAIGLGTGDLSNATNVMGVGAWAGEMAGGVVGSAGARVAGFGGAGGDLITNQDQVAKDAGVDGDDRFKETERGKKWAFWEKRAVEAQTLLEGAGMSAAGRNFKSVIQNNKNAPAPNTDPLYRVTTNGNTFSYAIRESAPGSGQPGMELVHIGAGDSSLKEGEEIISYGSFDSNGRAEFYAAQGDIDAQVEKEYAPEIKRVAEMNQYLMDDWGVDQSFNINNSGSFDIVVDEYLRKNPTETRADAAEQLRTKYYEYTSASKSLQRGIDSRNSELVRATKRILKASTTSPNFAKPGGNKAMFVTNDAGVIDV